MRATCLIAIQVLGSVARGPRAPKPGFIALRAHTSDGRPRASEGAADCDLACGDDAPKRCVPDCNAAVYQCVTSATVHNTKETQRCRKEILTGIKRIRTLNMEDMTTTTATTTTTTTTTVATTTTSLKQKPNNATANNTLPNNTAILAADRKLVRNKCAAACGQNANSSCVTSCEMEMYQCIDHTLPHEEAEGKREECFKKVLKKYEGFQEEWNATHGLVARHDANLTVANATKRHDVKVTGANMTVHYYKVTDADLKMIKDVCNAACSKASGDGAPSSMCITHCESDMYRCIKETLPDEMDERKKCRKDTEAKYESWGSSL